jgi:hypothetical protein
MKNNPACNSTNAIGGVACLYDTFVIKERAVLRMDICTKSPAKTDGVGNVHSGVTTYREMAML